MVEEDLSMNNEQLLDSLGLIENGKLKRAAIISYDNVTRIETHPLPKAAVREAVYNAIIHSNSAALVPIQIRIHEDAVYVRYYGKIYSFDTA